MRLTHSPRFPFWNRFSLRPLSFYALLTCLLAAGTAASAQNELGEGSDLELGGPGKGKGKFANIADLAFDSANNLYVLDTTLPGSAGTGTKDNYLIQIFSNSGAFRGQFNIWDIRLGAANAPSHLTIDRAIRLYITQPRAGRIQQYTPTGVLIRDLMMPDVSAITTRVRDNQEEIVAAANPANQSITQVSVFTPSGTAKPPITLSQPIRNCISLASDKMGCLYFLADVNQIYKFSPTGTLITVIGSGINDYYLSDGSVLLHTVAVDSKGNLFSTTPHNPGFVTRFSPDLKTYTQRTAQFSWFDAWGYFGGRSFTPYAIDHNDRLWVGVNGTMAPGSQMHPRPCVLRTKANFSDAPQTGVTEQSTLGLGVVPSISTSRADNLFFTLGSIPIEFGLQAAARRISEATLTLSIYDLNKKQVGQSILTVPLKDGAASKQTVSFTPPKWGPYEVQLEVSAGGQRLMGIGKHLGFSPAYLVLPPPDAGIKDSGPVDSARNALIGLNLVRTSTDQSLDTLEAQAQDALARKVTLFATFVSAADCAPQKVQAVVDRLKGKVKYWEVVNEPNLSMTPEAYVKLLKETFALIRKSDPNAKVMAPALCGIDLNWYNRFYQLGGKDYFDILTLHDYEGHESIDPLHWKWKWNSLRTLMAQYGDGAKPIWQTERAISGVRAGTYLGGCQAVRVTLHRDVLEALGTPSDMSYHFYTNDHGFMQCPAFLWSAAGPHPAALALRTRTAVIKNRIFSGTLDFGTTGNKLLLGLRYTSSGGSTVMLRNLGSSDLPVEMQVSGAASLDVWDAFGNPETVPVSGGRAMLTASALPHYVRLRPGQEMVPVPINFGTNLAPLAQLTYSGPQSGDLGLLTNGVLESIHAGSLKAGLWSADLVNGKGEPAVLEMRFSAPRSLSKMLVFGMRADNLYCSLLDFDVQAWSNGKWVTVKSITTPCPPSDAVATPGSTVSTWYSDQNFSVVAFPSVMTDGLRLVPRRATAGFLPDQLAVNACTAAWGVTVSPRLMLREVEIYE